MPILAGCGSSSAPGSSLTITSQPASETVPLGSAATFSVTVSGASNVAYQWTQNGNAIAGATSASYSIPASTLADNGAVFAVTAQSGGKSIQSSPATLTLGPRSPASGDLRFQQVSAPTTINGYVGSEFTYLLGRFSLGFNQQTGTPLGLGPPSCDTAYTSPMACAWPVGASFIPAGLPEVDTTYTSGFLSDFATDTATALSDANTVLTSVDIEEAANAYAISYITCHQNGGFTLKQGLVSSSAFGGTAAAEGVAGRVITGVTFNSGSVEYFSYAWSADTATQYETDTILTTLESIPSQAQALAGAGYIITAMGGNATDGYLLVGTRVAGDTLPRPILVTVPAGPLEQKPGYAVVGLILGLGNEPTYIGEQ